jgi:hypothetical protein
MTTGSSSHGQLGEDFHLEMIEAYEAGFDIEQYIRCRNAGVTHAEALEVHHTEVLPSFYLDARSEDFVTIHLSGTPLFTATATSLR